jgi:ABC-2 type transport system ATP-binding protein
VPLDTADRAADVLIGFRQAGVAITSVNVDKPTLDEVFFAITGRGAITGAGDGDDPHPAGTGTSEADAGHETVLEVQ